MFLLKAMRVAAKGVYTGSVFRVKKIFNLGQYPTFLIYNVTNHCNSRCIMCNIWKKQPKNELGLKEIKKIFSSSTFSRLRWINLTGGEPFMRKDLEEILNILNRLPKLEGIAIPSNGLMGNLIVKRAESMLEALDKNKFLSITLSIDGFEKTHDKQRGVKGGYKKVIKTFEGLKELEKKYSNFNVGIQPTISKANLYEMEDFYEYMKKKTKNIGFAVMLTSEGYYDNQDSSVALGSKDRKIIARFFSKVLKEQPQYGFYYSKLIDMFKKGRRDFGCLSGYLTLYMDPYGNSYPCPVLCSGKKYFIGNLLKNPKSWFGKRASRIRLKLKKEPECKRCTMMCDLINMAKVEFFEHSSFLIQHPRITKNLAKKIARDKNPYF